MSEFDFQIDSKIPELKRATQESITTALEAVGVQAQGNATAEITAVGAIETGRLKNSITFAVSGQSGSTHNYSDDEGNRYSDEIGSTGDAKENTVYLGTNVEYAPYVELGTYKMRARPFIRPAMEKNLSDYKDILIESLQKLNG